MVSSRPRLILPALAVSLLLGLAGQAQAQSARLVIHVSGCRSDQGRVLAAIVTDPTKWPPEKGQAFKDGWGQITDRRATVILEDVPVGTYAAVAFHDDDNSQELERDWLGRPLKPYGFSNNVRGTFGPPKFEAATFPVAGPETTIAIELK